MVQLKMNIIKSSILDDSYWLLAVGCWLLAVGCYRAVLVLTTHCLFRSVKMASGELSKFRNYAGEEVAGPSMVISRESILKLKLC